MVIYIQVNKKQWKGYDTMLRTYQIFKKSNNEFVGGVSAKNQKEALHNAKIKYGFKTQKEILVKLV